MAPGQVLVTHLGERLDRAGAATVGKGQAQSILTRMNELKRLQQDLKTAEETLVEATADRSAAEEALAGLEEEHQVLRGSRLEQERALRQAEQELFRAREALGVSQRQSEALEYDAEEIHGRLFELQGQAESLEVQAEQSQARTSSLESGLTQAQDDLAQARTALEEARRAEGDVRLAAASALTEAEQAKRESTRLEREIAQGRQRLLVLAADLQAAQDQVESLTRRRQEEQDRLAGLYEEMDRQDTAYRQARELHAQAQMRAGDLEADLKRARAELRQVESEIQEITLRAREIGLERENLCQQIMERCRVDLVSDHQAHLPEGAFDPETSRTRLNKLRIRLNRLGSVNLEAITEFEALQERDQFLSGQKADLEASLDDLKQAIRKINKTSRARFNETLAQVNQRLTAVFPVLFGGGHAQLTLDEGVDPLEAGLHILVELPGKKVKNLEALSGGEKALSAVAVLFALFLIRPAPFCILDEVDAPLDEANVGRFHDLLRQLSARSQIMMITHNRRTMEIMDQLYGVTMEEKGVSKLLSVSLEQGRAQAA
jgi:chromosome segregation protein